MTKNEPKKLLLIDGTSLAFRAFYAMINQVDRMINKDGLHTNALVAFNNFLDGIVEPLDPDYVLVAWDAGGGASTFRGEQFDDYKANRGSAPKELVEQFTYFQKMIEAHGIKFVQLPGYEADDIIGTLAAQADHLGLQTEIYTGDKDLTQLTSETTTVNITKKGVSEIESYTPSYLKEKLGLTPKQIIQMKALTGDASDNYPGVTKVGEKTAIKLLTEYGDIDNLYQNIDQMKESKLKENLIKDEPLARRAEMLATIKTDISLDIDIAELTYDGIDLEQLESLYNQLDFKSHLAKLHALINSGQVKVSGIDNSQQFEKTGTISVATIEDIIKIDNSLVIYFETATGNYHFDRIYGFAIGNDDTGYFASDDLELLKADPIKSKLSDVSISKITFNNKQLINIAHRLNIEINNVNDDVMLSSYLLDTVDNDNQISSIAQQYDLYLINDEDVYGKGAKFVIPESDKLIKHLVNKAHTISKLQKSIDPLIIERKLSNIYSEIELPLSRVLAEMEIDGIAVDHKVLEEIGKELQERIAVIQHAIYYEAGEEFNLNSPKQLGELLFDKMKLPVIKKTKTGYSTSVDILEELAPQAPIVEKILEYRTLAKLQSTYIEGLIPQIAKDKKIHTTFLQTLTQTGRLASIDPNLQNIPVRIEEGRRIRKAFVPENNDSLIFGADYSQIELRVLAHIANDYNLQKAFNNDRDIHAETARSIFHLGPDDEISVDQRRHAKAVNFGIVYGISDFGLGKSLKISRKEAKETIDTYFKEFPGVKNWIDQIVESAHKDGYVQTLTGRRRYLPDIHSKNFNLRNFAERTAMNSPIQGSAADIIKIAMIKINQKIKELNLRTKMLIQVHDELIFEVPKDELETIQKLVPQVMDSAFQLAVPLKVDTHSGANWYEAK